VQFCPFCYLSLKVQICELNLKYQSVIQLEDQFGVRMADSHCNYAEKCPLSEVCSTFSVPWVGSTCFQVNILVNIFTIIFVILAGALRTEPIIFCVLDFYANHWTLLPADDDHSPKHGSEINSWDIMYTIVLQTMHNVWHNHGVHVNNNYILIFFRWSSLFHDIMVINILKLYHILILKITTKDKK